MGCGFDNKVNDDDSGKLQPQMRTKASVVKTLVVHTVVKSSCRHC